MFFRCCCVCSAAVLAFQGVVARKKAKLFFCTFVLTIVYPFVLSSILLSGRVIFSEAGAKTGVGHFNSVRTGAYMGWGFEVVCLGLGTIKREEWVS